MIVSASATVYPELYARVASASGGLQTAASKVYLYDAGGNKIDGSEVLSVDTATTKALVFNPDGPFLRVSYINSFSGATPVGLKFIYVDPSNPNVDILLVDFAFDEPVTPPAWGLWSIDFAIQFTA